MINPRKLFVSRTKSDPTLQEKVDGRVFPAPLPQDVPLPSVSYQVLGDEPDHLLNTVGGFQVARLQVNIVAYSEHEISSIHEDISRLWLSTNDEIDGVRVAKGKITDVSDIPGVRLPGSDTIVRQRAIDLTIKYRGA